ncbi:sodium:solute symporter family protein [Rubinisphaera margarita]|uniref:sodium:solute symporter family protein n=1 Tax=Rubinisphaera margarita TaxID=2909586 RepID=UPI001EE87C8F|nr:sodium:solute symporter family protein [Rubinisphaera margarita]MCG6155069.1 sodium:solute symporter family protein [Rubinisphaera margarita]
MEISASVQWMLGITILIYLIVMYAIGYIAQRRISNAEDFLVAGRQLPLSLAWMTLLATWFGAGTLLAAADEVRNEGLQAAALDPFGAGCCLLLAGLFVAGPIWRMKILTVPDLFRIRFGPSAEWVSSFILVPSYFGWIAAQFTALAGMLELFFGLPVPYGLALVAVVGTGYTLMGGMWSVTLTDAVQISLVLLGLVILTTVVLTDVGNGNPATGAAAVWAQTPAEHRTLIPFDDLALFWGWLGLFLTGALGNLPGQDLMQRIFAARSDRTARNACLIAGGVYLLFGTLPLILALAGNLLFPEDVNQAILPALAHAFLNPVLAIVFVVTVMSAILSTIDSAILSPASVLAQNVGRRFLEGDLLKRNRYAVLFVALCSLAVAYAGESAYALLEEAYLLTMVGLFVPMMFGLYTRPRSEWPAVASMSVGFALWAGHYFKNWESFLGPHLSPELWPVPLSLTITGLALATYLIFEPPWRIQWQNPRPTEPVSET